MAADWLVTKSLVRASGTNLAAKSTWERDMAMSQKYEESRVTEYRLRTPCHLDQHCGRSTRLAPLVPSRYKRLPGLVTKPFIATEAGQPHKISRRQSMEYMVESS